MDLRSLEYLIAVVESGSMGRAAQRLHLSQPALSTAIAKLERELGVRLLERHRAGVSPTLAGEYLFGQAIALVDHRNQAAVRTRQIGLGTTRCLTISAVRPACWELVPHVLREFAHQFPDASVTLIDGTPLDILGHLADDRVDASFIYRVDGGPETWPELGLDSMVVSCEPLMLVVPRARSFPPGPIDLGLLEDERWAVPSRGGARGLGVLVETAWSAAGIAPARVQAVNTLQTAVSLVESQYCVALMPRSVRAIISEGVEVRSAIPSGPLVETMLLWRPGPPTALLAQFLEVARQLPKTRE